MRTTTSSFSFLFLLQMTSRCCHSFRVRGLWLDLRALAPAPVDPYASMLGLYKEVAADDSLPKLQGPAVSKVLVGKSSQLPTETITDDVSAMIVTHDDATGDLFTADGAPPEGRVVLDSSSVSALQETIRYAFKVLLLQPAKENEENEDESLNYTLLDYAMKQAEHCASISGSPRRTTICVCVSSMNQLQSLVDRSGRSESGSSSPDTDTNTDSDAGGIVVALRPDPALWGLALSSWASDLSVGAGGGSSQCFAAVSGLGPGPVPFVFWKW